MSLKSTRREFLSVLGAASAVTLGVGRAPQWLHAAAEQAAAGPDQRVLVLVQLAGGNDGLNTVVPYASDDYHRARPGIGIGKGAVLQLDDEFGLHPSLTGLKELHDAGKLSIVQGVGYPQPDRSHFRSMDIWHSAQPENPTPQDGWLGRTLEWQLQHHPERAEGLALGMERLPLLLVSRQVNVPVLKRLEDYHLNDPQLPSGLQGKLKAARDQILAAGGAPAGGELDFLRKSLRTAVTSSERLKSLSAGYSPAKEYPTTHLASQLKLVAQMIGAGLPSRIYLVGLDGFDTHSQQQPGHAALLGELGNAIAAFHADLTGHGLADRVLLSTFSEFGRRVKENGSLGTDHGAASSLFVVSPTGTPGFCGKFPSLTDLDDGDQKYTTDFRRVYATLLDKWLGVRSAGILGGEYEPLPFA